MHSLARDPIAPRRNDDLTHLSFVKARRESLRRFLEDCIGVTFSDSVGERIRLIGLTREEALLEDALTGEPTSRVLRLEWGTLVDVIRRSARSRDTRTGTMLFVVAGEGERIVTDWPHVVLLSGRTVEQIEREGVAHSILNPKKSAESW